MVPIVPSNKKLSLFLALTDGVSSLKAVMAEEHFVQDLYDG